ncbi:MAG: protein-tyrosine-phosphatase [Flavobacteriales bacterium]|nr:protein-tyrosine-phosphatase [Flavobacteriales bacterium]
MKNFSKISEFISNLDVNTIPKERIPILQEYIDFIKQKVSDKEAILINAICTHNSRRSHLAQIWSQAMASEFGVENVFAFSGGTEATAMFPMVPKVLEKTGFSITKLSEDSNPVYSVKYADNAHPIVCFSKTYDNSFNPKSSYIALMTCSDADEKCPVVFGSEKRIKLTYDDPKAFDNTDQQEEKYMERSTQIATEIKYVFMNVLK